MLVLESAAQSERLSYIRFCCISKRDRNGAGVGIPWRVSEARLYLNIFLQVSGIEQIPYIKERKIIIKMVLIWHTNFFMSSMTSIFKQPTSSWRQSEIKKSMILKSQWPVASPSFSSPWQLNLSLNILTALRKSKHIFLERPLKSIFYLGLLWLQSGNKVSRECNETNVKDDTIILFIKYGGKNIFILIKEATFFFKF